MDRPEAPISPPPEPPIPLTIRPEQPSDRPSILTLTKSAFANYPSSGAIEVKILTRLWEANAIVTSLVATAPDDPTIIGHAAFSPVLIDGEHTRWFGLGPLSVAPGFQRRGVGTALVRAGLNALREMGAAGCVLLGSREYYSRFGFASDEGLRYEDVEEGGSFMGLVLEEGGRMARGTVTFHEAFQDG